MPGRATVFRWLARNQEFRRSYALARQCYAEDFAFETLAIAADSSRDCVKTPMRFGGPLPTRGSARNPRSQ
jgi:hypothetical protein